LYRTPFSYILFLPFLFIYFSIISVQFLSSFLSLPYFWFDVFPFLLSRLAASLISLYFYYHWRRRIPLMPSQEWVRNILERLP
jgi:hypothetical protein